MKIHRKPQRLYRIIARLKPEDKIRYIPNATMLTEEDLLDFSLKTIFEKVDTTIEEISYFQMATVRSMA